MICINCQTPLEFYFTKKEFQIMRCPSCYLMVVQNVPEDLSPYYSEGYFTGDPELDGYMNYDLDKEVTKKTFLNDLDRIVHYLDKKETPSLFEVGCATGFFLSLAKERGWQVEGIDFSEYAVEQARVRGLKTAVASLDTWESTTQYDVLAMYDVIEHVRDPVKTIEKAYQLLHNNGLLVITTPDADSWWARMWGKRWHAFVPPQHLFYFSIKNLSTLLEYHHFKVIYQSHHGKWFAIPYIIRLLYSWTGIKLFSTLAERSSRSFLKKIALPINVRDTIFMIAKKV